MLINSSAKCARPACQACVSGLRASASLPIPPAVINTAGVNVALPSPPPVLE